MSHSPTDTQINWRKQLKETFLIALIGIPWGYLMCPNCGRHMPLAMVISGSVWVALWKGNEVVSYFIDKKYQWLTAPVKRLIWGVIGHSLYSTVAVFTILTAYEEFFNISTGDIWQTVIISIVVTILVTLILQSREFLINWKKLVIDSERIKKEAAIAKYETLKNQVNPHFLFNSFNTLTNLVFEDQELSAKFIKKLSDVYRYVLEARDKELVTLQAELDFVSDYVFLQKIRHEKGLIFEVTGTPTNEDHVPPMALQMLVENAIKHNIIAQDEPLSITINLTDDQMEVTNNLQVKNIIKENSNGVGLTNIKARYEFLTETPVTVDKTNGQFKVTLPIIKSKAS